MKHIHRLFLGLATAVFVSACGGGGGGGGSATPTLPADAATIDSSNAAPIANSAVSTLNTVGAITGAEAQTLPSVHDAINTVTRLVFDKSRRSMSVVTGVTQTYPCSSSGSVTVSYNETATSESGSASFSSCSEAGVTINGSFSYSSSWNNSTYDYTDSGSGSLTISDSSGNYTLVMNYSETGNESTYNYSASVSYSVSGIPGGGFLVTTTQNIVGNYYYGDVNSGQLIIQGANNTRLRITVTTPNTADVELDNGNGTFVYHSTISLSFY